ncbi:multidrug effflux MFS transporter [Prosthecodimorpha staleyi]|nr:multidrug effflux MFS transporter [Prosthecodimorpha staleyi]
MLKPNTLGMTLVLALLIALGPMSTDMYLPSLPAIGRALQADSPAVQLTLSGFMFGFAIGQVLYGPVSDRLGRKPVLVASLSLYALASALCAFAWSIETLIAARFIQALGACGPIVIARAIVRDLYSGDRAGQELSRMGTIMAFVPAVAPVVGAGLEVTLGWRANFLGALALAGTALWFVVMRLPETVRQRLDSPLSVVAILTDFGALLRSDHFRLHVLLCAGTYGGLFAFISGSSFVLQGLYGLGEIAYGLAFGACALAYMLGTVTGRFLVRLAGMARAIGFGAAAMGTGGLAMAAGVAFGPGHVLEIVAPMMVYMIGVGIAFPLTQASALMPFPERAGAASSLIGLLQMTAAAVIGIVVGAGAARTAWALAGTVAVVGVAVFVTERVIAARRV